MRPDGPVPGLTSAQVTAITTARSHAGEPAPTAEELRLIAKDMASMPVPSPEILDRLAAITTAADREAARRHASNGGGSAPAAA